MRSGLGGTRLVATCTALVQPNLGPHKSPVCLWFHTGLLNTGKFLCWVHQSVEQSYVASTTINTRQQMCSTVVLVLQKSLTNYVPANELSL